MTEEHAMPLNPQESGRARSADRIRATGEKNDRTPLQRLIELSKKYPQFAAIIGAILYVLMPQAAHAQERNNQPDTRAGAHHQVLTPEEFAALTRAARQNGDELDDPELVAFLGDFTAEGTQDGVETIAIPIVTAMTVDDGKDSNVRTSPLTGESNRGNLNGKIESGAEATLLTDPSELTRLAALENSNVQRENETFFLVDQRTDSRWEIQQDDLGYFYINAATDDRWYLLELNSGSFTPEDRDKANAISGVRLVEDSITATSADTSDAATEVPEPNLPPTPGSEGTAPATGTQQAEVTQPATGDGGSEPPITPVRPPEAPRLEATDAPGGNPQLATETPDEELTVTPTENPMAIMSSELGQLVTPTLVTDSAIFYMPENMYGRPGDRVDSVQYDFTPEEVQAGVDRWLAEIYRNLLVANEVNEAGTSYRELLDLSSSATIPQILEWIAENRRELRELPLIPYRYTISNTGNAENDYRSGFADPNEPIEFYPIPANMRPGIRSTDMTATPSWMELTPYERGLSSGFGTTVDQQTGSIRIFFAPQINDDVYWTDSLISSQSMASSIFSSDGEYERGIQETSDFTFDLARAWGVFNEDGFKERATVIVQ